MAKQDEAGGFDRREALRRLMTGAGVAGATAALPATALASGAEPALDAASQETPAPPAMSLGAAQPPDPGLTAADWKPKFLDDHQDQTVLAVADVLIPDTDTPGARAAQVDRFIDLLLSTDAPGTDEDTSGTDFADLLFRKGSLEGQKRYIAALNWLDGYCLAQYSRPFTGLDRPDQETILDMLTHANDNPQVAAAHDSFALIKSSIVTAYYSSEIGTRQELKYQTNPYQTGVPGCEHPEHDGQ
ncbi:MAG TPA: gluconate 2-dehydrogenase subunit 3 family protein [Terriglobia bacterium]|nr:gluconate 2-dehydrogenase subunit 3 family protein [Terriglobia bacterium]